MAGAHPIRYFDHAATSWPKPPEVVDAMVRAMAEAGGNPGRGAHALSLGAARTIAGARSALASLLGVPDDRDIIFTAGCTSAVNLVLKGSLVPGDRVVVSSVEHNSVVRPLLALAALGIEVSVVRADVQGRIDADEVERAVRARPTRAVICQHASNVTGAIQPIGDLADIAHEHDSVMIVDGAQGAGHIALDLSALGADAYACSGHKGLLGPQGIGVLYLSPAFQPTELVQGGGGGDSGASAQPSARPDRYEAGTGNTPGAAGLGAAARLLRARGDEIRATERRLTRRLHEELLGIDGIRVLGPPPGEERVPVVSVTHDRLAPDELAFALERRAGIAVRAGLHCSPWTHETVGTAETGALRFGLGLGLTDDDVDAALEAMREIIA
ncbi:MAG: aminotransferase class V-fold PLP-dependent enzyme [Coriobacteriia bacterium]|nr:aminotransferase class V-fold PLP-dependent enzyme [Actinomycetota bacterium]MDZ4167129.1 aminotransferase class V-fold PLP-dependent enzyme [Coriobacteriia bacterium]